MEGRKIVPFPGAGERVKRADVRAREEAVRKGTVNELYSPLDLAKVVGIQRIIDEEKRSLPGRFTKENLDLTNVEVEALAPQKAIEEINTATETMVRFDPVRYVALLDFIELRKPTSQDD